MSWFEDLMYFPFGKEKTEDFLFGTEGGIQTKRESKFAPEQWEMFRKLMGMITPTFGQPRPRYPGQMVAPPTPQEQQYLGRFERLPEERKIYKDVLDRILSGEFYGPEYVEQQIGKLAPVWERAGERAVTGVKAARGGRPGYRGWGTERALSEAVTDVETKRAMTEAGLWSQYEQLQTEAMREAVPFAAEEMGAYTGMLGVGAEFSRQMAQQQLSEDMMRWEAGEEVGGVFDPMRNPYFQLAIQLLGLDPYYVMGGTVQPQPGFLQELAGGLGTGAGAALMGMI